MADLREGQMNETIPNSKGIISAWTGQVTNVRTWQRSLSSYEIYHRFDSPDCDCELCKGRDEMNKTIQPATDEEIAILEDWDFETLSRTWALELIARIRADTARIISETEMRKMAESNYADAISEITRLQVQIKILERELKGKAP
jgi:hypothetical protein